MGKINAYDEIMTENQRKRKYGNQIFFTQIFINRWFRNTIHRLLSRADAIGSADVIYRM